VIADWEEDMMSAKRKLHMGFRISIRILTTTGALIAGREATLLPLFFSHDVRCGREKEEGRGGRGRLKVSSRWWKSDDDVRGATCAK
jgi:hypothetical protein